MRLRCLRTMSHHDRRRPVNTTDGDTVVIERGGIDVCLLGSPVRDTRSLVRPCTTAPSSIATFAQLRIFRLAGATSRMAAGTACGGARMRQCSGTRSVRTRGSSSCSLRACRCGERGAGRTARASSSSRSPPIPRYAFFGVRSCELHAIAIQDRVFSAERQSRSELRRAARGCAPRGGELQRSERHMLLHFDGDRAEGELGLRPSAD